MKIKSLVTAVAVSASLALFISCSDQQTKAYTFGGGPTGGTFNYFANAIATYLSRQMPDVSVASEGTGGSSANLKMIDSGNLDFGTVYAGDIFLGQKGELAQDPNKYTNVMPVSYLYGAPAQLVVLANSDIQSPKDLAGRRVAVGNAGSGAALSAERYFRSIGVWEKMDAQFLGYSAAASALRDRQIDAFWVLVGYPNASIIEAASADSIRLLDLQQAADEAGFYDEFPFYSPTLIPADTYTGQTAAVPTFQDSTLWSANKNVDADFVYEALKLVYSEEGLKHMVQSHNAAREMTVESGTLGFPVPMHPGAFRFWSEKGLDIPAELQP